MSWSADFTDELLRQKRAGASFDRAWERALNAHKPELREIGGGPTSLLREPSLIDDARSQAQRSAALEWYRGVCGDAWHNLGPRHLHLLPGIVGHLDAADLSSPARKAHASKIHQPLASTGA